MKHIFLLLLTLFLYGIYNLNAQNYNPDEDDFVNLFNQLSFPLTPEASSLIRTIEVPVDKYTGIPDVNIPLHTVKSGYNDFTVSLNYHSSGVRLTDRPTIVGLNWRLCGPGSITRVVKGYPDNYSQHQQAIYENWTSTKIKDRIKDNFDAEPDLYYFEAPGISGIFVHDENGVPYVVPHQNIQISRTNNGYTIVDAEGNSFIFNTSEYSRYIVRNDEKKEKDYDSGEFVSTYYLNKIIYENGHELNFIYGMGSRISYTIPNMIVRNFDSALNGSAPIEYKDRSITYQNTPRILNSIEGNEILINFYYTTFQSQRVLDQISFTQNRRTSKNYKLNYDGYSSERIFLNGIEERNAQGGNPIKIASFEYHNEKRMPGCGSYNFDHWGFWNGEQANPPVYAANAGIPGGYVRDPDFTYTRYGTLKKINYRTGGSKELQYELNSYTQSNKEVTAGGLRIKKIIEKESPTSPHAVTEYDYENGVLAQKIDYTSQWYLKRIIAFPNYEMGYIYYALSSRNLNNDILWKGTSVNYESVTETLPNNSKIIYEYGELNRYPDLKGLSYTADKNGTTQITSNARGTESPRGWKRQLLTKVSMFNSNGELVKRTRYSYSLETPILKSIRGHTYYIDYTLIIAVNQLGQVAVQGDYTYYLKRYDWNIQPVFLTTIVNERTAYEPYSSVNYTYHPTYLVPVSITEKDADDNIIETRLKYPFDFTISGNTAVNTPGYGLLKKKETNYLKPIEKTIYYNSNLIYGEINEFICQTVRFPYLYTDKTISFPSRKYILRDSGTSAHYSNYVPNYANPGQIDNRYNLLYSIESYGLNGSITGINEVKNLPRAFIYGSNGNLLIAEVLNGQGDNSFHTSFEYDYDGGMYDANAKTGNKVKYGVYSIDVQNFPSGKYMLIYHKRSGTAGKWERVSEMIEHTAPAQWLTMGGDFYIDDVSLIPYNARIRTFTHLPDAGITSETDHGGKTIYYDYDDHSRLNKIFDNERFPLKEYRYNIKQH